jgi:AsmA protein
VKAGAAAAGWPTDRLDASGLAVLDASIALSAESADLGLAKTGALEVMLTIDRARAVFDIRRIAAYDGVISGQFVVNARKGLSVGGDLGFTGMNLQSLMQDFAGYERLVGRGDLRLKFLGSGQTVDAIMQGLEGSGSLKLGQGEILGLDIGGMIRSLDMGYVGEGQRTVFDSLTAGFSIAGGVLQNDDLAMQTPFATVTGKGNLGLGKRTINYRLRAEATVADQTLTAPILIKGPWADPKISLDLEALAKEKLGLEKEKLEAAAKEKAKALEADAKAKAKAKLESELGVVQQDGESIEDAVKRRGEEVLTDEAAKALGKLLGGN